MSELEFQISLAAKPHPKNVQYNPKHPNQNFVQTLPKASDKHHNHYYPSDFQHTLPLDPHHTIDGDLKTKKKELQKQLADTKETVSESGNYKMNRINSGIDKKSKRILATVSDILSERLSKSLVDEIIDEIIKVLNKKVG